MLKRVVIGAVAVACLLVGAAHAQEEGMQLDDECTQRLAATEEAVATRQESAPMSDEDFAKINELLDEADAQCTEGNLDGATATLGTISGLIGH